MYLVLSSALAAALFSSSAVVPAAKPASCTVADRPASITRSVDVRRPLVAEFENLTGTSKIRVDLSETGALEGASVAVSSGSRVLDLTAIAIVKSMVYAPEIRSCTAVSGSYAVEVTFDDPSS